MCTLALLWRVTPIAPLVIAQCRDEALTRPARDVERWRTQRGVEIVGGCDLLAGGTWFGIGPRIVCGLTNRCDAAGPRRGELSRGALVVEALEAASIDAFEAQLHGRAGGAYGPFSLLAADADAVLYVENSGPGGALEARRVEPGIHVLGNFGLDNWADPVVRNVTAALRGLVSADERQLVRALEQLLARSGEGWPNVDDPERVPGGYGTRSAGVLLLRGDEARLFTTAGAPDVTPWRDQSDLLRGGGASDGNPVRRA